MGSAKEFRCEEKSRDLYRRAAFAKTCVLAINSWQDPVSQIMPRWATHGVGTGGRCDHNKTKVMATL